MPKKILILLGGYWHDFAGFAAVMTPLLQKQGYAVETTDDFERLSSLAGYDLLLSYTCLGHPPEGAPARAPAGFNDPQFLALENWVRNGGGFLAVHAATIAGTTRPDYERLVGGAFLTHPPELAFTVLPLAEPHPITDGIPAFEVRDELYLQRYAPDVSIHMVAVFQQVAYPVVWSKPEGAGRVVHVALGHSPAVWRHAFYQRLMLQALAWLAGT